ncbi:COG1470 family protein [[Eubacterium] cellulosolvens]
MRLQILGKIGTIKLRNNYRTLIVFLIIVTLTSSIYQTQHLIIPISGYPNGHSNELFISAPLCAVIPDPNILTAEPFQQAHPVLGAIGEGDITLVYDSSFPVDRRGYAQELFDFVYPEIKLIYGNPSNTIKVILSYDPDSYPWNYYYGATNTITMSQLPSSIGTSPSWDAVFTHELIHAFHDAIYLTPGEGSWAEEGMTEAATQIVAMNLQGRRDIVLRDPVVNLKYYDVWSFMGKDVLGGGPDFTYKLIPDMHYRISSAMFFILTTELSSNPSNPYDFLSKLNNQIYSQASSNPIFSDDRFRLMIRQAAAGRLLEGQLADVWIGNQPVTSGFVDSGFQIGVYPYRPENPTQIRALTFLRLSDAREIPVSEEVDIRIIDSEENTVRIGTFVTGSDGTGYLELDSTPLPLGGYQIIATTNFNGIEYEARNYAFSQGESILIEQADTSLYGVTLDEFGRPISSSVSVSGGTVDMNSKGAFRVEAESQVPPFELTVTAGTLSSIFGKPNPYTRVVWANSTVASITPYSVSVNINGLPSTFSTNLLVDGEVQEIVQGGETKSLTFEAGTTHQIEVDSYVNSSSTDRFYCDNNVYTVTSGSVLDFTYFQHFYSTFQQEGSEKSTSVTIDGTLYSIPIGLWWAGGSNHTFSYQSNVSDGSTRYILTETSPTSPIIIEEPLTVMGVYKKQYILNVSTVPANLVEINGSGWHNSGSKIDLEAPSVSGFVFKQWIIDGSQVLGDIIQIEMDTPHTVIAEYQSEGIYDVIITALYLPENSDTEATFTWDGKTHTTPYTFTGISGSHELIMSSTDNEGHSFTRWKDLSSNSTSRTISAGGTYTAYFGTLIMDFTLSIHPEHQRIGPGQSTTFTIEIQSTNGLSIPVTLGIKGLPVFANSTFRPRTLTAPSTSILEIDTFRSTPVGSYVLTITATGNGEVRTVNARLSMGACVVATATYGSELSPEVQFLRSFRDELVKKTFAGESFMLAFNLWYYSFSPSVADIIIKSQHFKTVMKFSLYPLLGILHMSSIVYTFFEDNSEIAVFMSGIVASFLIGTVYFTPIFIPLLYRKRSYLRLIFTFTVLLLSFGFISSIIGESILNQRLMMLGTSMFVIGILTSSICIIHKFGHIAYQTINMLKNHSQKVLFRSE